LYEEPTDRESSVFANADGHDLARCYVFIFNAILDLRFQYGFLNLFLIKYSKYTKGEIMNIKTPHNTFNK
jgi:hypothetical protein